MKTVYYLGRMENGRLVFFTGFAPGGLISTGERSRAVPLMRRETAEKLRDELNAKLDRKAWFVTQYAECDP